MTQSVRISMEVMENEALIFEVRDVSNAHPTHEVRAVGFGKDFVMQCDCLAGGHGALLCPHIVAVIRENRDLVMYGHSQFADLKRRSRGSRAADPDNGYWKFYPPS